MDDDVIVTKNPDNFSENKKLELGISQFLIHYTRIIKELIKHDDRLTADNFFDNDLRPCPVYECGAISAEMISDSILNLLEIRGELVKEMEIKFADIINNPKFKDNIGITKQLAQEIIFRAVYRKLKGKMIDFDNVAQGLIQLKNLSAKE